MQPVVYMLWHTYEMDSGEEESKLIGVYSSEERAKEALEQIRAQPGFRDHPEGFLVDETRLDLTSWVSGFSSAPDADEGESKRE